MQKYKGLGRIGAHLDRLYIQHNVDGNRVRLNEDLSKRGEGNLCAAVEERIASGYKKKGVIRKDAVKAVGVLLTGSHERMKEIESNSVLFDSWKEANYRFACEEFGEENIVRFSIHRDEKTPHIHCVFVPITKEGGLSAKQYMNGRDFLRGYQDRYGKAMEKFGLERGESQQITQAVHIPMEKYYSDTSRLIRDSHKVASEIRLSNGLVLPQVRQKVENRLVQSHVLTENYRERAERAEQTANSILSQAISRDLERVKQEVNLVQHAASMGYELDKEKSSQRYAVMKLGNDKVIINTRPNEQGHWVYMSAVNEKDKGTVVDFMLHRGYEYREIRGLSSHHLDIGILKELSSQTSVLEDVSLQECVSKQSLLRVKSAGKGQESYLEKRGIERSTYDSYVGRSLEVSRNRAVFSLYREVNSEGEGRLCSTLSYGKDEKGGNRKHFLKGLPRGLSLLKEGEGQVKRLIIMESPIDALSHKQLKKEVGNLYISTCGSLTESIKEELGRVIREGKEKGQEILVSFDNDDSGWRMSGQVESLCKDAGTCYEVLVPEKGKDWNEELEMLNDRTISVQKRGYKEPF